MLPKKNLFHFIVTFLIVGLTGCSTSREIELDPDGHDFYETARLIMSKKEREIFNHLPDQKSRKEFIDDFWKKRDPDPDTEVNEFKEEFLKRIDYANKRFNEGKPGWKTDRGRIYIYFGPPDKIEQSPFISDPNIKGYLLWIYYRYDFSVEFMDKRGDGTYTLDPYSGVYGNFFDAMERAIFGFYSQEDEFTKKFFDFDLEFNEEKKEIVISIPVKTLTFVEESGLLKADFEFEFHIYEKGEPKKEKFRTTRHFEKPEHELLRLKHIDYTFSFDELKSGSYYFDVVIMGKPNIGIARKIFKIKFY